jgi:hypothetical protein
MAAVVANKVKRNRTARKILNRGGEPIRLEIDSKGRLKQVGGAPLEEEDDNKKTDPSKHPNAGYYRKVKKGSKASRGRHYCQGPLGIWKTILSYVEICTMSAPLPLHIRID